MQNSRWRFVLKNCRSCWLTTRNLRMGRWYINNFTISTVKSLACKVQLSVGKNKVYQLVYNHWSLSSRSKSKLSMVNLDKNYRLQLRDFMRHCLHQIMTKNCRVWERKFTNWRRLLSKIRKIMSYRLSISNFYLKKEWGLISSVKPPLVSWKRTWMNSSNREVKS